MELNEIKLRLKRLISGKSDRLAFKPVKILQNSEGYYLILKNVNSGEFLTSRSLDGTDFDLTDTYQKPENFEEKFAGSAVVTYPDKRKTKIMYFGDRQVYLAKYSGKKNWNSDHQPLLDSPYQTEVGGAFFFTKGVVVVYYEKIIQDKITYYEAFLAEFAENNPTKLLWKTEQAVWKSKDHWPGKKAIPLGSVKIKDKIAMYWYVNDEVIYSVFLTGFYFDPKRLTLKPTKLLKHSKNPIIKPRPHNSWEAFTTLNPAAAYINNQVHILYRAQGYDYISKVGYAVSSDGLKINQRLNHPIYSPTAKFETNQTGSVNFQLMSAGGYGGCEDPRITLIGDRVYMVYVAFDGWSNLRLAMTSINVADFLNQRWNWEKPVLISPPHVIDKSGCLLPEKINGYYVFFHRIFPNILIDFVKDLNFKGKKKWLTGEYKIKIRPGMWDSRKIGAGAPPLKTKDGWLLIYYGVDDLDASKYHIGAMLLDLNDPTKVLYRTNQPILSPEEEYENNGFKPGIAYPCGAVIVNNNLLVYYGAADSTVCVAQAEINSFLNSLKSNLSPKLHRIEIKEINY